MKDVAIQVAREAGGQKLNVLREYLQNYLLFLMQKLDVHTSLYFVGGTALRFLYRIRRFSEDMDFSALESWGRPAFSGHVKKMQRELERAGYTLSTHVKEEKAVQRAIFRFAGLLYEVGLSRQKTQNLNIAIEIDTNPPEGWSGMRTIVDIHLPVVLQHYDLSSLFGAKLAAILSRPYTKGRDVYDLFWYRTKWRELEPNLCLMNNALSQAKMDIEVHEGNWPDLVRKKIKSLKWKEVEEDVRPFLESPDDLVSFTQDNLLILLADTP